MSRRTPTTSGCDTTASSTSGPYSSGALATMPRIRGSSSASCAAQAISSSACSSAQSASTNTSSTGACRDGSRSAGRNGCASGPGSHACVRAYGSQKWTCESITSPARYWSIDPAAFRRVR